MNLSLVFLAVICLTGCTDYIMRSMNRGYFIPPSENKLLISRTCDTRWDVDDPNNKGKMIKTNPAYSYILCTEEFENEPEKMKLLKRCAEEVKTVQPNTRTAEYHMLTNQCLNNNHINLKADGGYVPKN